MKVSDALFAAVGFLHLFIECFEIDHTLMHHEVLHHHHGATHLNGRTFHIAGIVDQGTLLSRGECVKVGRAHLILPQYFFKLLAHGQAILAGVGLKLNLQQRADVDAQLAAVDFVDVDKVLPTAHGHECALVAQRIVDGAYHALAVAFHEAGRDLLRHHKVVAPEVRIKLLQDGYKFHGLNLQPFGKWAKKRLYAAIGFNHSNLWVLTGMSP